MTQLQRLRIKAVFDSEKILNRKARWHWGSNKTSPTECQPSRLTTSEQRESELRLAECLREPEINDTAFKCRARVNQIKKKSFYAIVSHVLKIKRLFLVSFSLPVEF